MRIAQGKLIQGFLFFFIAFFLQLSLLSTGSKADEKSLTIAAAADLSSALKEISSAFEKETGIKVILSFGSTGMLAQQIEHGAPFDLFFAANKRFLDDMEAKGLIIPDTKAPYAQGRIVLAVNKKAGITAKKLEDLREPKIKRISLANPDHAPYGIAAKEALMKLGLWDSVKAKIVYGENVRQALQFVQTGDAPAGIIALSVADVPQIEYVLIDSSLHNPLNQELAVLRTSKLENEARKFISYVNGPKGRPIMKKYGFLLPGEF